MKVLVYGSRGWIGTQFMSILVENGVHFTEGKVRVDQYEEVRREISEQSPTHVISFIGRTHGTIGDTYHSTIDYLEQPNKLVENVRDNLFSPLCLAEICRAKQIHFTYLGTGCIFTYDESHPYGKEERGFGESDKPNFFGSSYSVVKGFTDRLIHLYDKDVLNLRIRMPINDEKNSRNFITKITTYQKVCSIPNSMTVLPELLGYVLEMMRMKLTGTMNLTNPGLISHNEILEMYRNIVDPKFTWNNFTIDEQRKILAADRSNNFLDTSRLETLFPNVRNIKDAVEDCLRGYKRSLDSFNNINSPYVLLVTGGCGFIGSHFINHYFPRKKPTMLINLDAMYYCASEQNVDSAIRESPDYKLVKINLTNMDAVSYTLNRYQVTHVIHFAAQSHVQNSFEDSLQYTHDNIMGTHVLLEACRKYGKIQKFVHVSTDEVYGESMNHIDELHKTEHSVLCPTNPYAATKAGAELIAQSYNHSYKMPIIITRGNNVYGPNQYPEKLIPRFIEQLKTDMPVTIQGDGSAVRAFLHVSDTVTAFELILEKGAIGEIYNIGCDENMEYSVLQVAQILIRMIKDTEQYSKWILYVADRPFNDQRYYISNQKIKDLGWKIEKNFLTGLSELVTPECGERLNFVANLSVSGVEVERPEQRRTTVLKRSVAEGEGERLNSEDVSRRSLSNSNKIVSYIELHADHKKYESEWESNMQYSASHN